MIARLKWWEVRRAWRQLARIGRKIDQGEMLDETDYRIWARASDVGQLFPALWALALEVAGLVWYMLR